MSYAILILTYLAIYVVLALGLNLLVGYCGLFTLAHAAFFMVGAYAFTLVTSSGFGLVGALLAAVVASAVLSLMLSLPAWRLRRNYFLLLSLAVQSVLVGIVYNWSDTASPVGSWRNLTNGPFGITGIRRPPFFGLSLDSPLAFCCFAVGTSILASLIMWHLMKSPWGRLLKAMRDDELALRGLGKNPRLCKVQATCVATAFAGASGALYAGHIRYVDASLGSLDHSILMLSVIVVGGLGTFSGSLIGAFVLVLLPELLRLIPGLPDATAANLRLLLYGIVLVLMMRSRPQGLLGTYRSY